MYYRMYLSGVCNRRQWPDPYYQPWRDHNGHFCKVTVNNREYRTDIGYKTEELARDNAAMKAYLICRNFSANDGMYPGQRPGQVAANGIVQGLPVAIGAPARGRRRSGSSSPGGWSTGGSRPNSTDGSFDMYMTQAVNSMSPTTPYRGSSRVNSLCACGRGYPVRAYNRCEFCLNHY